jgi:hypothetical protein
MHVAEEPLDRARAQRRSARSGVDEQGDLLNRPGRVLQDETGLCLLLE